MLIITDGEISDEDRTIEALVEASSLPLSVVVVGVGNDSFKAMNCLDADEKPLNSGSNYAIRDIVQFVPFRNYKNEGLAEATLAEIPRQVTEYMANKGIKPNPKVVVNDNYHYGESFEE